ncbi:MAG: hypothetical protein EOP83_11360 [Verrucomicrobiaceae bacterium]|nr:MAG: hypothetical protein EOP83_11360 [Verrucomicrobiaceae bacterium]
MHFRYHLPNACRFTTNDMDEIQDRLIAFREPLDQMQRDQTLRLSVREVIKEIDAETMKGNVKRPLLDYIKEFRDRLRDRQKKIKATSERDPTVDYEFIVQIFRLDGQTYGRIISEQETWVDALVATGLVVRAPPYVGEDDDESARAEALALQEAWTRIVERDPAKKLFGFTSDYPVNTIWDYFPSVEELVVAAPSMQRRARTVAMDQVRMRRYHEQKALRDDVAEDREWVSGLMAAHKFSLTEAGQQLVEAMVPEVMERLIPFTVETIRGT